MLINLTKNAKEKENHTFLFCIKSPYDLVGTSMNSEPQKLRQTIKRYSRR